MTHPKTPEQRLQQTTTLYCTQLIQQGVPPQPAGMIALAIARFEVNQGRPQSTTRQLIYQYKTQICQANLWRFQLLSPTSRRRIDSHLFNRP